MNKCKDLCRFNKKFSKKNGSSYEAGGKRCRVCSIFVLTSDKFCFCCNNKLSTRPIKGRKNITYVE